MSIKNSLTTLLAFLSIFMTSCSGIASFLGSGPSNSDVKSAVEKTLTKAANGGMTVGWWATPMNMKVNSVEIVQRGEYNEAGKYYPILAKVEGSYHQKTIMGSENIGMNSERDCTFVSTDSYRLSKTDYGEWVAQLDLNNSNNEGNDDKINCDK